MNSPSTLTQPFDRIVRRYRLVNAVISLGLDAAWRRAAVDCLELNSYVILLDVGSGMGEMARVAEKHGAKCILLDPVTAMLGSRINPSFLPVTGAAEHIPLRDESVDAICSAFAVRNFSDRMRGVTEMFRALKPGGRLAILEFSPPPASLVGVMAMCWVRFAIPLLGGFVSGDFPAYRYLAATIRRFPDPSIIAAELSAAGFTDVRYRRLSTQVTVLYTAQKPNDASSR